VKLEATLSVTKCCPYYLVFGIFAALHGMQTRSSDENSVRPSVCLSVKCMHCLQNGRKICPDFIPYETSFSL